MYPKFSASSIQLTTAERKKVKRLSYKNKKLVMVKINQHKSAVKVKENFPDKFEDLVMGQLATNFGLIGKDSKGALKKETSHSLRNISKSKLTDGSIALKFLEEIISLEIHESFQRMRKNVQAFSNSVRQIASNKR